MAQLRSPLLPGPPLMEDFPAHMMYVNPAAVVEKEVEAELAVEAPAARTRLNDDFGRPGGGRPAHLV